MDTPAQTMRILIVDDSEGDAELISWEFARAKVSVHTTRVQNGEQLAKALGEGPWEAVICDYSMPAFNAMDALEVVQKSGLDLPFLVVSGSIPEHTAIELMRRGAHDYLLKDSLARLVPATLREIREAEQREHRRKAEQAQKAAEEELRQAQKLEAIGRLSGGVAHDFNNILTVILGNAKLMEDEGGLSQTMSESLAEIVEAGERAANLTRQLLAFSRKQAMKPERIDFNRIMTDMGRMLRRLLGEHIDLELKLSPTPGWVHADEAMLEQVLLNLAINARDAMPSGGRLTLSSSRVDFTKEKNLPAKAKRGPVPHLVASVKDTGCGIPPEILPRIFEPFFTTKDLGKGTGLGLATVYGIVEQHNGWIEVQSDPGKGTEFRVFLPFDDTPIEAPGSNEQSPQLDIKGQGQTVLLVEDDNAVRALARRTLSQNDYRVIEANSATVALAVWEKHAQEIDLLVTDIVMPDGINGFELAARLKADKPRMLVIYCTGYLADIVPEGAFNEQGVDILHKPYTPDDLLRVIAKKRV